MCSVAGGGDVGLCDGLGLDKSRSASAQVCVEFVTVIVELTCR